VGIDYSGAISKCHSTGGVEGRWQVGGLIGFNQGDINICYSSSSVIGNEEVGGLVGSGSGTITNCYSIGSVSGSEGVGGLTGKNFHGTITNCYSTGSVLGNKYVGGLVGQNGTSWGEGAIINCYSKGSVSGRTNVGGLLGGNTGRVRTSFWDIETSGQDTSDGGTGLPTIQMQAASTFIWWGGCGNEGIWTLDESNDYPHLWWEEKPGEPLPAYQLSDFITGAGTQIDPYLIYTAGQFNIIGLFLCDWDKHFKLMADIDLAGFTGTSFNIIGYYSSNLDDKPFTGLLDGNGHIISNFTYMFTEGDYIGLFGYVYDGDIRNLGLIDPNVDAGTGNFVGSLVGVNGGTITGCYVKGGSVSGHYSVGGLAGANDDGTISNCYSKSDVSGDLYVGGLVGMNWGGTISHCYSTGSLSTGKWIGGLMGYNSWIGYITNSFWDVETSGQTWSYGGGLGRTTAEMQTISTFTNAGWDFMGETINGVEDIWFILQQDFPHLWWEGMEVPMKMTPRKLNCRSYGNWLKARLTLPEGFTVEDVDSNKPAVLHSFGFQSLPLYVSVNENGLVEILTTFEREALCSLAGDWPDELTVVGFLADGNIFLGTSAVRINHPGMKVIEDLAMYWLNEDCVHPDFCNEIDMNRDSLVNLMDYALLMNINVEFVTYK
jgi:hypothetical protein